MIQVADNFNYRGKKPNFDRDSFDTLQDMKNYSENSLDDGHISYCKETGKHYKFNSNNQSDNIRSYGDTQHRPIIDRCNIGTMYFDTTLGKPIFNKNNSQWVDATGATV